MTNMFVLIFYLLYSKRDLRTRRKIFNILYMKSDTVESDQSQIKNVIGEPLVVRDNYQVHFTQLDKYWS